MKSVHTHTHTHTAREKREMRLLLLLLLLLLHTPGYRWKEREKREGSSRSLVRIVLYSFALLRAYYYIVLPVARRLALE